MSVERNVSSPVHHCVIPLKLMWAPQAPFQVPRYHRPFTWASQEYWTRECREMPITLQRCHLHLKYVTQKSGEVRNKSVRCGNFLWMPSSHCCRLVAKSCLTLCNPMEYERLLCPWDSLGRNTGVGYHIFPQGNFPLKGSNPCLLSLQADSLPLSHQGSVIHFNI